MVKYLLIILLFVSASVNAQRINYGTLPTIDSISPTDYFPALRAPNSQYKATYNDLIDLMRDSIAGATIDTANKWVNRIQRTPGKDSIIFFIGATRYAIKDSVGGSGSVLWGSITGDLVDQTDLLAELNIKKDITDSGRGVSQYVTGATLNKVRDSLQTNIEAKLNISDTAAMMKRDTTSAYLLADFTTSNTTATNTGLKFQIGANQVYRIVITGTVSKATTTTGLKIAIGAPTGCTIKAINQVGATTLAAAMANTLITAVNTLGATFSAGAGVEVPFRVEGIVTNGANAGVIELQVATVTSNAATVYAGTSMTWQRTKGL